MLVESWVLRTDMNVVFYVYVSISLISNEIYNKILYNSTIDCSEKKEPTRNKKQIPKELGEKPNLEKTRTTLAMY